MGIPIVIMLPSSKEGMRLNVVNYSGEAYCCQTILNSLR